MTDLVSALCFALLVVFALIGAFVVIQWIVRIVRTSWDTLCKLNTTLHEAIELLKVYRADFTAIRAFYDAAPPQGQAAPNFGPESDAQSPAVEPLRYPPPPWEFFAEREKRPEPDAEEEAVRDVDVTPREDEEVDAEKVEKLAAAGFGVPDPEFIPKAVEANSE